MLSAFPVLGGVIIIIAGLGILAFTVYVQTCLATSAPLFDHWAFFINLANDKGRLSLRHLFEVHNGHWLVVPRLLFFADYLFFDAKNTLLFACITLGQAIQVLIFCKVWLRVFNKAFLSAAGAAVVTAFLFSPVQIANFLWPWQISVTTSALAVSLSFYCFSELMSKWDAGQTPPHSRLLISGTLGGSLIASLSFADGLFTWPVLVLFALLFTRRRGVIAALVAVGAIIWVIFMWLMHRPSGADLGLFASKEAAPYAEYLLAYVGGIWGCFGMRAAQGFGVLGIVAGIGLTAIVATKKKRQSVDIFAVCQASWFLCNALVTSAARSQLGVPQALESRYQTFSVMFWLTLFIWASARVPRALQSFARLQTALMLSAILLISVPSFFSWRDMRAAYLAQTDSLRLTQAALLSDVYDRNEIRLSAMSPEVFQGAFQFLRVHRKSLFSERYFYEPGTMLSQYFRLVPRSQCAGGWRKVSFVLDPGESGIKLQGWATSKDGSGFSNLLVTDEDRIIGFGTEVQARTPGDDLPLLPEWTSSTWIAYGELKHPLTSVRVYGITSAGQACPVVELSRSEFPKISYPKHSESARIIAQGKPGVFRAGLWTKDDQQDQLWNSTRTVLFEGFGTTGDLPVCGDWSRSGRMKMGLFRAGSWLLDLDGDGRWNPSKDQVSEFGAAGDIPVLGDWDHTGQLRIGVFRQGVWLLDIDGDLRWEPNRDKVLRFGDPGDTPVVGDWSSDGRLNVGVFQSGRWMLDTDGDGIWDPSRDKDVQFGAPGDLPVVGNWDGLGHLRIGVFRKGAWLVDMNGNLRWDGVDVDRTFTFGGPSDQPIAACW